MIVCRVELSVLDYSVFSFTVLVCVFGANYTLVVVGYIRRNGMM